MQGLTVHQPWATAIARLGKRVENRGWRPPERLIGSVLAVHAGKQWMPSSYLAPATERSPYDPKVYPAGVVVAVAKVTAACTAGYFGEPCDCGSWALPDHYHWRLGDVEALPEPVPCRGYQGLWTLPPEVAEKVAAQLTQLEATP